MVKLWTTEHVFSHPWKQVTEAAWRKYPNELNTNVLAIDVIDRKVTNGKKLTTTRIFGSQWNLPRVITSLLGMPEMCYAIERSEVDMKEEKMTLKMINYTFWGILSVEETLVYQPSKLNPNETHLTQGAKIQINGIQFANYFEGVIVNNFESTSQKGRKALEQVLNKIQVENIVHAVTREIRDLSELVDKHQLLSEEWHVKKRLDELNDDLDRASSLINCEFKIFSTNLQQELKGLLDSVEQDLQSFSKRIHGTSSITEAVLNAGITAKTIS